MKSKGTTARLASTVPAGAASVSWGGVFAGTIVGLAFLLVVGSFWTALGYGSNVSWWRGGALDWWLAATAIVAMGLGAFVAAWVGRIDQPMAASLTGSVLWALFFLAVVPFGLPALLRFVGASAPQISSGEFGNTTWFWFGTMVLSLGAAWIGAAMGSASVGAALDGSADQALAAGSVPPHEHRGGQVVDLRNGPVSSRAGYGSGRMTSS